MATHALTTPMPAAHPGSLRARMEHAVEQMLAAAERLMVELDAMAPDPDLEDGADDEHNGDFEPSLGSTDGWLGSQRKWAAGETRDLEHEHDGREPDVDAEYTLGRSENIDQTRPDHGADDLEPSLGAANPERWTNQTAWGVRDAGPFPMQDFEDQCEDEGGACEDEGAHDDRETEGYS